MDLLWFLGPGVISVYSPKNYDDAFTAPGLCVNRLDKCFKEVFTQKCDQLIWPAKSFSNLVVFLRHCRFLNFAHQ